MAEFEKLISQISNIIWGYPELLSNVVDEKIL